MKRFFEPLKPSAHRPSLFGVLRTLFLILCVSMMAACSKSVSSGSVDVPSLSETALKGGSITPWPQGPITVQNTTPLVARLRQSEVRNARAINACKAEYGNLQKLLLEKP